MGVNESEIEGATVVPIQGVEVKDAGEFAAYWNSLTPENREAFVGALRDASDGWLKCFREDHERELGQIRRLHEVATERTVQLAAVIEAADARVSEGTVNAVRMHELLRSADTSVLRERDAVKWQEGYAGAVEAHGIKPPFAYDTNPYIHLYRQTEGESE